jgi:hypothetical protein
MANTYDIGDVVRLTGTFSVSGTNTDPTTVTLRVMDPTGNKDVYTYALAQVTKSATGIFYKDVTLDESGHWWYRYEGTGAAAAVLEEWFEVRERKVGSS